VPSDICPTATFVTGGIGITFLSRLDKLPLRCGGTNVCGSGAVPPFRMLFELPKLIVIVPCELNKCLMYDHYR
jgi:hypothetical protein